MIELIPAPNSSGLGVATSLSGSPKYEICLLQRGYDRGNTEIRKNPGFHLTDKRIRLKMVNSCQIKVVPKQIILKAEVQMGTYKFKPY
jgi:hypothetical protein